MSNNRTPTPPAVYKACKQRNGFTYTHPHRRGNPAVYLPFSILVQHYQKVRGTNVLFSWYNQYSQKQNGCGLRNRVYYVNKREMGNYRRKAVIFHLPFFVPEHYNLKPGNHLPHFVLTARTAIMVLSLGQRVIKPKRVQHGNSELHPESSRPLGQTGDGGGKYA